MYQFLQCPSPSSDVDGYFNFPDNNGNTIFFDDLQQFNQNLKPAQEGDSFFKDKPDNHYFSPETSSVKIQEFSWESSAKLSVSKASTDHTSGEELMDASDTFSMNSNRVFKKRSYEEIENDGSQYVPSSDEENDSDEDYQPKEVKKSKGKRAMNRNERRYAQSCLTKQNKMKNHQGTSAQKVKQLILTDPEIGGTPFFQQYSINLKMEEIQNLRNFVMTLNKQSKTWTSLEKFLKTDPKCGTQFLSMILAFFDINNPVYFNEWLNSGKMCEKTKKLLREPNNKIFYIEKFKKMSLYQDEPNQEKISENPRKRVKTY